MHIIRKKQLNRDLANVITIADLSNFLDSSSGKNLTKHSISGVTPSHHVADENSLKHIIILDNFYVSNLSENKSLFVFESCCLRPKLEDCESILTVILEKEKGSFLKLINQ